MSLVAAFGLNMTGEQVGAINVAAGAILSVIARQKVTPTG